MQSLIAAIFVALLGDWSNLIMPGAGSILTSILNGNPAVVESPEMDLSPQLVEYLYLDKWEWGSTRYNHR